MDRVHLIAVTDIYIYNQPSGEAAVKRHLSNTKLLAGAGSGGNIDIS